MQTARIKIEGMTCHHCVMAVKNALQSLGINSLEVQIGSATFEFDENQVDLETIRAAIAEEGYKVVEEEILKEE